MIIFIGALSNAFVFREKKKHDNDHTHHTGATKINDFETESLMACSFCVFVCFNKILATLSSYQHEKYKFIR